MVNIIKIENYHNQYFLIPSLYAQKKFTLVQKELLKPNPSPLAIQTHPDFQVVCITSMIGLLDTFIMGS